jgi:hypothetical protein
VLDIYRVAEVVVVACLVYMSRGGGREVALIFFFLRLSAPPLCVKVKAWRKEQETKSYVQPAHK